MAASPDTGPDTGFAGDGEPAWLQVLGRRYGAPVSVVGSEPLGGGYVSDDVRRYELLCAGRPVSVVWKRTTAREVAALRAVDEVPGIGGPWLLAHGSGGSRTAPRGQAAGERWVVMPHHGGTPLTDGQPVPEGAYEILARVHARYVGARIPGVPVVDAAAWWSLCLDVALPAVRGAAQRAAGGESCPAREVYRDAEARLLSWAGDERMRTALAMLPATLAHGDLHRGNILEGPDGDAVIIDWGGARIAPGGLDLAVLAEQGGVDHDRYHHRIAQLSGMRVVPALAEVEQHWALAMGYVQYLGFAADCLGAERVGVMVDRAAQAFEGLGAALARA